jgi:F5/8 type C domain
MRGSVRKRRVLLSQRCSELIGRARLASLLAESAYKPVDPFADGPGDALACELSRQSIHWALLAHRELEVHAPRPAPAAKPEAPRARGETLQRLWEQADPELLARAAGSPEALAKFRAELEHQSFVEFAELEPERQAELAPRLHAFAALLLEPLARAQRERERSWLWRMLGIGFCVVLLLACVITGQKWSLARERRLDLAATASWTASSRYQAYGCTPPLQFCAECPDFFVHTLEEENPWLLFDLGKRRRFSTIHVENRRDCCNDRGLPLVVSVSSDKRHWHEVARRTTEFTTWREHFPTVNARWVKLHVPGLEILHLATVRVLP